MSRTDAESAYERVVDRFGDRVVRRGGEAFFRLADALELVAICRREDMAMLGVEGFFLRPPYIEALLAAIGDFSVPVRYWTDFQRICNDESEAYLRQLQVEYPQPEFVVAVSVMMRSEWGSKYF
ncbi:hypothetical protein [Longimicrobium terrae]|uniref:Pyruvate-formate lyase-activating enzyme n=1 Tax=Longimicrobium terrae TaxID=1639882 RepID=A0A841GXB3_9BACT|nr:hypothetical protein [Longimicrobium terrae]MBB4635422.1 pyruvate-formate lyase-activating enzyme [Longimicrobium terrae]MBB6069816.1 pyruvate-formate lyase-activating enzyme [Longimicrobium terrae]NNC30976.1 hypothetical protein [Longimicrobium terrae]NNC32738.1 hypothetical protein [Longimicrobium terrae]